MKPADAAVGRLSVYRIEVSEATRRRQLAAISVAVRTTPPTRTLRRPGFRRRWAGAIATFAMVIGPVGTAVAAEGALPGELLYPVKQMSERMRGVFDEDLAATHRIEELEVLLDQGSEASLILEAEQRAAAAVAALADAGELDARLEQAQIRIRTRARDGGVVPNSGLPGGGPGTLPTDPDAPPPTGPGGPADGGDPLQDRDRSGDGSGDGSGSPPATSGGGGSGNGEPGGSGSGGTGSGGGDPGSGDPGSGDPPRSGDPGGNGSGNADAGSGNGALGGGSGEGSASGWGPGDSTGASGQGSGGAAGSGRLP